MMESIHERVTRLYEEETERYKNDATATVEALQENATEEKINAAVLANYNLMYHVLKGNIVLDKDENINKQKIAQLDNNMKTALEKLKDVKVDDDQNNNLVTRFFNSIGWASHTPRRVNQADFPDELKKSPVKQPAYHCDTHIAPSEKMLKEDPTLAEKWADRKDARWMGEQFAGMGKSRHYLSNGQSGKGTYLGVPAPGKTEEERRENEKQTRRHLWDYYGKTRGSYQLTMCYNEHARIVKKSSVFKLMDEIRRRFPQMADFLRENAGESDTLYAAMYGYNTINVMAGAGSYNDPYCIYYVTSDRKALTLSNKVYIMTEECIENDYNPDYADLGDDLFNVEEEKKK
jgi:hypothetical protein